MQWRRRSARGLGSIVGAVILAIVLIAVIGFFIAVMRQINNYTQMVTTLAEQRAAAVLAAKSLVAWWRINYPAAGDLYINATNTYSQTIIVTGVTIVWSDGSYTILDRHNGSLTNIGVTAEVKTAATTTPYTSFPIPVPPGGTLILVLNGYATSRTPSTVSIALTAASQAAATAAKNYYLIYPATAAANATFPAIVYLAANVTQLQHVALAGTNTWLGLANVPRILTRGGTVYQASVPTGSLQAGSSTSLQTIDNVNLTVVSTPTLMLSENNTIYYDDFASNPFTAGRLVNDPHSNYTWRYSAGGHVIYAVHQVSASASGTSAVTNTSVSIAYVSSLVLNSSKPFYELAVVNESQISSSVSVTSLTFEFDIDRAVGAMHFYSPSTGNGYLIDMYNYYYGYGSFFSISIGNSYGLDIRNFTEWYNVENFVNFTTISGSALGKKYAVVSYVDDGEKISLLYNRSGLISEGYGYNTTWTSGYVGPMACTFVYVYRSSVSIETNYTIYYFLVSWANPRFVNVTGFPPGYEVVLLNSTGGVVDKAVVNSNGVATLNVTMEPIIRGASFNVYDTAGNLVLSYRPPSPVIGGNVYRAVYGAAVESYVSVNTTGLVRPTAINVSFSFQATALVNATLYIYDWVTGSFVPVKTMTNIYGSRSYVIISSSVVNYLAPNGTILVRLDVSSANSFTLNVDELNANLTGLFQTGTAGYTLFEAVGGSNVIDVYSVYLNPLSGNVSLVYVESIDSGTVFNGSAAISYDLRTGNITLVNSSGVYVATPVAGTRWQLLVPGSECRATGPGTRIIAYNTTTTTYLLVVPGEGNTTGCLISYSTPSSVTVQSLSLPAEPTAYTVDALDDSAGTAYLLLYDPTAAQAVVYPYSFAAGAWGSAIPAPGVYAVGMAWNGSGLYVLYERGSLYYIDPITGSSTYIPVQLPFYPFGAGDRLEYYSGWLLFVRADGTNELWEIYVK